MTNPTEAKPPAEYEPEQWIDEGSVRDVADAATRRASTPRDGRRAAKTLDPGALPALERAVGSRRAPRLGDMLAQAREALDRERYPEAERLAKAVVREASEVAAAQEILGLTLYRLGRWRSAAAALEIARSAAGVRNHAVLADCYRALRRYDKVEELWLEVREASPDQATMAEARIVAAGALADQGDFAGALKTMGPPPTRVRRVREHHLKQWYVIADLYDRSGDVPRARQLFELVVANEPDYADARSRLAALGR